MIQFLLVFSDWGILTVRIVLSMILIERGWFGILTFKEKTEKLVRPYKAVPGLALALLNCFAGAFILIGFLTQIFSALIALQFLAVLLFRKRTAIGKRTEVDFLILASSILLITMGSGAYGLESFLNIRIY